MSRTLNKVMLIGHLKVGKIHRFEDGGCVGRFPLATNETYMNKQANEKVSNMNGLIFILVKLLKFAKNIYLKGIKYTLKVESRLENGKIRE